MMHFFTSVVANYIPKARVLASSVKQHNPGAAFHLVLADQRPSWLGVADEPFDSVILASELGIEDFERWAFKHSVVELCTAVKAFGFRAIRTRHAAEKVVYLDPDMVVLGPLDPLEQLLDQWSIVLTPHQTEPETTNEAVIDNEICSLKHGVFNLGFLALRSAGDGPRFVDWWAARLGEFCYDDIPAGLFTDQRWVDLAPCFFEDLHVLRDPSYNVATWNLTHRQVTGSLRDGLLVNGRPLRIFHFSGFDSGAQEVMLKKYGGQSTALFELRRWYIARCAEMGQNEHGRAPCVYDRYSDGQKIERQHRLTYRSRADLMAHFPEPFRADDADRSYRHWYAAEFPRRWPGRRLARALARGWRNTAPNSQRLIASLAKRLGLG